ncbi:MAG: twin-arginine translocation signal domain-containing protein, partial [Planctomycetota bacterium]
MNKGNVSRRSFLKTGTSGAAAAGAIGLFAAPATVRARNLNSNLRVGFIGTGGRGNAHLGIVLKKQLADEGVEA